MPTAIARARRVIGSVLATRILTAPAAAQAPGSAVREGKPGGVLRPVLREDLPQGFAIHETATNSVTWPAMFAHHAYVKNLIPNQVTYDCCRLQEVWLDK